MATSAQHVIDEVSFYDAEAIPEKNELNDLDLEKATIQHEFSSPWDDSDLILVVEEQKLHVHRVILKMASPVFKAMLSSDFKEKDANEIALPGKKVNEFVDLLRQIYPLLESEITLKNIIHIYILADEYQMTKVMKDCRMFLSSVIKTKENAMDMLLLAQDIGADEARQQCYEVLKQMTLTELESQEAFTNLDGHSMHTLLLPIVKRFQKCVKDVLPELLGSLDGMLFLWNPEHEVLTMPNKCPNHRIRNVTFDNSRYTKTPNIRNAYERIRCNACKAMFKQMATNASKHISPSQTYLSENVVNVLEEIVDLLKD